MNSQVKDIKPQFLYVVDNIVNRRKPTIIARAIIKYYNESRNTSIIEELRQKFNFSLSNHSAKYHANQELNQCECIFCRTLKRYVSLKKSKHRFNKRFYNEYLSEEEVDTLKEIISKLNDEILYLKKDKNELKRKLNIP